MHPIQPRQPSLKSLGVAAFICALSFGLTGRLSAQSTVSFEAESLTYTPNGATASVQTDANSSGGKWVELASTATGQYISFAIPSVAAGTYQLQMEWKGNTTRGILQLSVDGTNLGGTVDQYSAAQSYPTTTFGNVTFGSAGTHTIRLTVTGKNSASSSYQLSADKFTFVGSGGGGGNGTANGNPILPPKWAFGIMFGCYDNQTGVLSDMSQLRNGYCGDLIWVDSSWLSSNYNGPASAYIDFKFDSSQFSDPTSMISTLHSNHFHFGVWEWPWIGEGNQYYNAGVAGDHFFIETSSGGIARPSGVWHGLSDATTGQFDLSSTASSNWWKSLNQPLFTMGFDFLKTDTTVAIPSGGVLANGSTSNNDWRGFYHKAAWEITSTANLAQGRGLVLAHSDAGAATNNDQYPGLWTGDSTASFSSLLTFDMAHAHGLNTKTSAAYWCGDTGGYNDNSNDELYQRWLEYSTFTPLQEFFGAKGTTGSNSNLGRFPWCFSSAAQATFSVFSQLRYQLLPFRYSNAQACYHITGTVQYPVWWPSSIQIINGHGNSEILVQPVTTAGATTASVIFPSGNNWIDYWTGTVYTGGSTKTVSAPVNQVPLFISAGAIIPMLVPYDSSGNAITQQYVDQYPANPLTLDIYPSGSTSYTLYEDDGISDLYITDNEFSTTLFSSNNTSGKEVVTIGAANGSYVGQFANRTYYLEINQQSSAPASVTRDGNTDTQYTSKSALIATSEGWYYDSSAKIVWVKFSTATNASTSVSLH
jgi:alpha-glucosidase